jgi:hypothetical protein
MASYAMAVHITNNLFEDTQSGVMARVDISAILYDSAHNINDGQAVTVYFAPGATPQQIRTAISDAVLQAVADHWPQMSLSANNIILPDLSRG